MAGIGHRQRAGPGRQAIAGEHGHPVRVGQLVGVQAQFVGQAGVQRQ